MIKRVVLKDNLLLSAIQYLLGIVIVGLLAAGLLPGMYNKFTGFLMALLILQIMTSFLRFKLFNVFFEICIFILAFIGIIPYLGWIFRLLALPVGLLDIFLHQEEGVSKKVVFFTENNIKRKCRDFMKKRGTAKGKKKEKVYDAEFKEK